jgi:hypothetical protein
MVDSYLWGVSCLSATSCKAVGDYENSIGGAALTLIESWNGSKWTVQSSPTPGTGGSFSSVSCVSTTSCKAVGSYFTSSGDTLTLIESWNGSRWTVQSSPNPGTSNDGLSGVSCVSTTSCKAVAYYSDSNEGSQTLIESWNGSHWTIQSSPNPGTDFNILVGVSCVPSPNPGTPLNYLEAVSCVSATSCKAVGFYRNSSNVAHTLIESYG